MPRGEDGMTEISSHSAARLPWASCRGVQDAVRPDGFASAAFTAFAFVVGDQGNLSVRVHQL